MKKLLMFCFVCFAMLGAKNVSAQSPFNFYHHFGEDWDGGTTFVYHDDGTTSGGYADIYFNTSRSSNPFASMEIYGLDADNNQVNIFIGGVRDVDNTRVSSPAFTTTDPSIVTIDVVMTCIYDDPIDGEYDQDVLFEYNQGVASVINPIDVYPW